MDDTPKPSALKTLDNFVRGLANGLTFGAADTIAAAADTVITDGGGKENETIGAAFKRNNREQDKKTAQALIETKGDVEAGELLGSMVLGFGLFRLLRTGPTTTGLQYKGLLEEAGRAWAQRKRTLSLALLTAPMPRAMSAQRAATIVSFGATGISQGVNRAKHPEPRVKPSPDTGPSAPTMKP